MGFADMLIKMRTAYDSRGALNIAEDIMSFINKTAWDESCEIAKQKGAFPNLNGSIFDKPDAKPVRNATTTTIAPTGTLSIIAGCSSGIEPVFSLNYTRQVLDGLELPEIYPLLNEVAIEEGFYSKGLMEYVASGKSIAERQDVPSHIKRIFVTAYQISPQWHIKIEASFQRHTDNAVSKTINMPKSASHDDVRDAYLLAYKLGCKGITIYRSGTRPKQVLTCKDTLYC